MSGWIFFSGEVDIADVLEEVICLKTDLVKDKLEYCALEHARWMEVEG